MASMKRAAAAVVLVAGMLVPVAVPATPAAAAAGAAPTDGWTTGRGGPGASGTTTAGPSTADLGALRAQWSRAARYGSVAITDPAGSTVFAGCQNGGLCAYDVATGALQWDDPDVDGTGAATETTVYEVADGAVLALDARSGNVVWASRLPAPPAGVGAANSAVELADGLVYVQTEAGVLAFDASSGRQVWAFADSSSDPPDVGATPVVDDGVLLLPTSDALLAFDARTGKPLWAGDAGSTGGSVTTSGAAVVLSTGSAIDAFDIAGCGAAVCEPVWSDDVSAEATAVSGDVVLAGVYGTSRSNGALDAFDLATGQQIWTALEPTPVESPTVANGVVYLPDAYGSVYVLPADGCGQDHTYCPTPHRDRLGPTPYAAGVVGAEVAAVGRTLLVTEENTLYAVTEHAATPASTPAAPHVGVAHSGPTTALLGWAVPADHGFPIQDYVVADSAGDPPTIVSYFHAANIPDLTADRTYRFHVAAVNAVGQGPWSKWETLRPLVAPQEPTEVTATAGNGTVTASWDLTAGSPLRLDEVSLYVGGQYSGREIDVPGDVTQATIGGLTDGTAYTVAVSPDGASGPPAGAPTVTPTASGTTQAPSSLAVAAVSRVPDDRTSAISATVTSAGQPVTGGYVDFYGCDVPVVRGRAVCPDEVRAPGRMTYAVDYTGTPTAAATSSTITVVGTLAPVLTHLTVTGKPEAGHPLVARVTIGFDQKPEPASQGYEGEVELFVDGVGAPEKEFRTGSDTETFVLSPVAAGTLHLHAEVLRGTFAATDSPTVTLVVGRDGSRVHLRTPAEPGVGIGTVAAVVSPDLPGLGLATGTVVFRRHGKTFATGRLDADGVARVDLPRGATTIAGVTAFYDGDGNLLPAST